MKLDNNVQGHIVEHEFVQICLLKGILVSKPIIDIGYDFIIDINNKLSKVQVKSTRCKTNRKNDSYILNVSKGTIKYKSKGIIKIKDGSYNKSEVDFIVAKVIPENTWYIIPIKEILGKTKIRLSTDMNCSWNNTYANYRENWDLLSQDGLEVVTAQAHNLNDARQGSPLLLFKEIL